MPIGRGDWSGITVQSRRFFRRHSALRACYLYLLLSLNA